MTESYDDLLFGVRKSVRYHDRRELFFGRVNRVSTWLSLVFGSGAAAAAGASWQVVGVISGMLVAVFGATDLVLGATLSARDHRDLKRRFAELEIAMMTGHAAGADRVAEWSTERLRIETDELPVLHTLERLCHNEVSRALGRAAEQYVITNAQRRWANWISGPDADPPRLKDVPPPRALPPPFRP